MQLTVYKFTAAGTHRGLNHILKDISFNSQKPVLLFGHSSILDLLYVSEGSRAGKLKPAVDRNKRV